MRPGRQANARPINHSVPAQSLRAERRPPRWLEGRAVVARDAENGGRRLGEVSGTSTGTSTAPPSTPAPLLRSLQTRVSLVSGRLKPARSSIRSGLRSASQRALSSYSRVARSDRWPLLPLASTQHGRLERRLLVPETIVPLPEGGRLGRGRVVGPGRYWLAVRRHPRQSFQYSPRAETTARTPPDQADEPPQVARGRRRSPAIGRVSH